MKRLVWTDIIVGITAKKGLVYMKKEQKNGIVYGWSAAGFAAGFAIGYLTLDGVASGIIMGIGLALAMGLGGKEYAKRK